jgi:hypothetical protein
MAFSGLNHAGGWTRWPLAAAVATAAALLFVSSAVGISNGPPDGNGHPYVGMLAVDWFGTKYPLCSGSYAGKRKDDAGVGVFLTAGHCLAELEALGGSADQLYVTFDTDATYDLSTGAAVTGATTWYHARDAAFDPAFGHDRSNMKDYGVVLLESSVDGVGQVELPSPGLLDQIAARGALRPGASFDNVGYGLMAGFQHGKPTYAAPPGRMFSTSFFQALTPSQLKLLMNANARGAEDNGGICLWDSGSPKLLPGTDIAVAVTSGADNRCRAESYNQRLDTADARAFLGRYLDLTS